MERDVYRDIRERKRYRYKIIYIYIYIHSDMRKRDVYRVIGRREREM